MRFLSLIACTTLVALFSTLPESRLQAAPGLPEGVVNTQAPGQSPRSPTDALSRIQVPDGFNVSLFAGEPDIRQPIAFTFDDRGRLWVVECYSYPKWKTHKDRIIILEDSDQDGQFDKRSVFYDKGHRFAGIQVGFGGVWVAAAPNLLFIPDRDGDDKPDGEPIVKLDGFTLGARHNTVNGLTWGLDGWMYGRHGILAESKVGRPGTPEEKRTKLNCSLWRYHPVTERFEVVIHGTTNPWGLDFNDHGQAFFSNNVIGHLWHLVPGARYKRMYGKDYNPHSYDLINASSDHLHWGGSDWRKARGGQVHSALGGGHSHSGAMIYLGDNWPDQYRGALFMHNIHGNRMLFDRLERKGSGYVASHGGDFLLANDPWFRGVTVDYGPDGGVYVSDWNDFGECHDHDGSYRGSGRIYKITYGQPRRLPALDLSRESDAALVKLQLHRNDWFVRHARRILQERATNGTLAPTTAKALRAMLHSNRPIPRRLRALWTLHGIGETQKNGLLPKLLTHESEYFRWWAVQLLTEEGKVSDEVLKRFISMAKEDESALVRLSLASALQRLPESQRWDVAGNLLGHEEDATDATIPLMIWYAVEPLVELDSSKTLELISKCRIPQVRQFLTRRLTN